MTRYHATSGGNIPFTAAEEVEADAAVAFVNSIEFIKPIKSKEIDEAQALKLNEGIVWKLNPGGSPNVINLTTKMQLFFSFINALRQRSSVNPHNGTVFQKNTEFSIDDAGIDELGEFAGVWGLKISQIARAEKNSLDGMTLTQLQSYDAGAIDWTVTWSQAEQTNGWSNNQVSQNP